MRFDFSQGNLVEAFVRQRKSRNGWLDEIDQLMDWEKLEDLFDGIYDSKEGAASYPILTYVRVDSNPKRNSSSRPDPYVLAKL